MKTNVVIFDFDGVLVNSEAIALAELKACLAELGIRIEMSDLIAQFLGASFEDIQAFVYQHTDERRGGAFRENWYARLFDRYSRELSIMQGAAELLDELDLRGVTYCIASGGSYRRLNFALDVTGLRSRFADRAFSADSVPRGKPEPDLFLFAAQQMNAAPEDCLVVEDSIAGVSAAARAGIRALAFVGGSHLAECQDLHGAKLRHAGAAAVLSSLQDVLLFIDAPARPAGN